MRTSRPLLPVLPVLFFALLLSAPAGAQLCSTCTPNSSCAQYCENCLTFEIDGCSQWEPSTCGESGGACMECTPNYVEVARELRGTYGNGDISSCSHHRVDWVTRYDVNECNTSSAYWTVATCEDTIDGGKNGGFFPDCCNGFPNSTYTCNHQHNC